MKEEVLDPYEGVKRLTGGPTEMFEIQGSEVEKRLGSILFGVRGAGGAGALGPVAERLAHDGFKVFYFTDSEGKDVTQGLLKSDLRIDNHDYGDHSNMEFERARSGNPLIRLAELTGDRELRAVVLDSSLAEWDHGMFRTLYEEASENNLPVVLLEYAPGTAEPLLREVTDLTNLRMVCVTTNEGKEKLITFGLNEKQIAVTGNPEFDAFAVDNEVKLAEKRQSARGALGIGQDEFLIDFATQPYAEIDQVLKLTVEKLNKLVDEGKLDKKKLVMLVSPHPKITRENEWWNKLRDIANGFRGRLVYQGERKSDEVRPAADLLINVCSTEGLKASFERTPAIFICLRDGTFPDIQAQLPSSIPSVRFGAALELTKEDDFSKVLLTGIVDEEARQKLISNAKLSFNSDGKATERMVGVITNMAEILDK